MKHGNVLLHRNQIWDFIPFRILQVLLSPFSANHIQQSLFHRKGEQTRLSARQIFHCCVLFTVFAFTVLGDDKGSCFSFLRFIDVSPAEMSNLMLQGTLVRWVLLSPEKRIENEWFSSSLFFLRLQMVSPFSVPQSCVSAPPPAPVWPWRDCRLAGEQRNVTVQE